MSAHSPEDLVGAVLGGRWRLVRMIGEGGMGAVFEADGPPGAGKRAIKLLHREFAGDEGILARFLAEFQAAHAINHPNVAQVLETATAEDGTPYIVMELLQGTPVSSYVDRGIALPVAQAVHIAHGVLLALAAAHARGIVHRDIKPDNLFLVNDNAGSFNVKVLDFGIAKVMDAAGGMGQKTRTGVLLGTPGYMSPEQIKNSKGVDPRTDLWSVGIILYELFTGTSPFPADNEFTRLTSVLSDEVRPIGELVPQLASWAGFFQRALAKDSARRFQSADEMDAALFSMLRGKSLRPPATLGESHQAVTLASDPAQPFVERPSQASFRVAGQQQTAAMSAYVERPSAIGPAPISVSAALAATSPMQPGAKLPIPVQATPALQTTSPMSAGAMPTPVTAPAALQTTSPMSSGIMPAPMASMQAHVAAVSQGSIPPPPRASTPPPPLAAPVVPSGMNVGPTHVSAQSSAPTVHGHAPSVEVVNAPPRPGAPYWVVGLVAFVAFGLGLALGLALR